MRSIQSAILPMTLLFTSATLGACFGAETDDENTSTALGELRTDCEGNVNGFLDISDRASGTVQRKFTIRDNESDPATVTLESAIIGGVSRGFARFNGSTRTTDQLWMDWSEDGRILQCGPFPAPAAGQPFTTPAFPTSTSALRKFRACARPGGANVSICNDWW